MKHIKEFETSVAYNEYINDVNFSTPYVYETSDNQSYNLKSKEELMIVKYKTTSDNEGITLFNSQTDPIFEYIEIDGVKYTEFENTYTFATPGYHIVKYKFINNSTSIPANLFAAQTKLVGIRISDITTSIGTSALNYTGLEELIIPDNVTSIGPGSVAASCYQLKNVTIGSGVETIPANVFGSSSMLNKITLRPGVTTISEGAFAGLMGLEKINFPNTLTSIGTGAFNGTSLKEVTIPGSVTSIGSNPFAGLSTLKRLTLNEGLQTIGSSAFAGTALEGDLIIPDTVTSVGPSAFGGARFSNIHIGESVSTIGDAAFACRYDSTLYINQITIDENNISFDSRDNCNAIIETSTNKLIQASNSTTTIPSTVTSIASSAFSYWSGTEITIPASVTSVGQNAFSYCSNLQSVTILNETPPTFVYTNSNYRIFNGCTTNFKIYVPKESLEAYKTAAGWSYYADKFYPIGVPNNVIKYTASSKIINSFTNSAAEHNYNSTTHIGELIFNEDLTTISTNAFYNCSSIIDIELPNSLESISSYAFYGCTSLIRLDIKYTNIRVISNYAFYGCTKLYEVDLPSSLLQIGIYAFDGCSKLTDIIINGTSIQSIGSNAFMQNTYPKKYFYITNSSVLTSYTSLFGPESRFYGTIIGPKPNVSNTNNNVIIYAASAKLKEVTGTYDSGLHTNGFNTSIISHTYSNGYGIITFNVSVTEIKAQAMSGSYSDNIISVDLPDTIISIGTQAFNKAELRYIKIPKDTTSINIHSFDTSDDATSQHIKKIVVDKNNVTYDSRNNCNAIIETSTNKLFLACDNTIIPNTVTSIGNYAFRGCWLHYVFNNTLDLSNITSIGNYAFSGVKYVSNIILSNNLLTLGTYAFQKSSLTNITISSPNITSIPERLCSSCTNLTTVTLTNNITSIGKYAFFSCSSLNNITIPASITSIDNSAFHYCSGLTSVTVLSTTPPTLGSYVFTANASGRIIYVPEESVDIYKAAAGWSDYADYIQAIVPNNIIKYTASSKIINDFTNSAAEHNFANGEGELIFNTDVTSLPGRSFYECSELTSIELPATISSIYPCAVVAENLTKVVINATTPPSLLNPYGDGGAPGTYFMNGYDESYHKLHNFIIYVPDASVNTYKTNSYYSYFYADIIQPISNLNS